MASTRDELFAAIEAGDAAKTRAILDADPELATARDDEGVSALMRARYRSDRAVIDAVRGHVAEPNIYEAAAFGDAERINAVLAADPVAVAAPSADGFTPLHLAAFFGHADAARTLLERGAEPDRRGTGWMTGTALHAAVSGRHPDIVEALLAAGSDPNLRQAQGWTPLHGAAHNGDARSTELLLAHGAAPSATNDDGRSVEDLALERGDAATIAAVRAALN
jgi:uncharacterized protein